MDGCLVPAAPSPFGVLEATASAFADLRPPAVLIRKRELPLPPFLLAFRTSVWRLDLGIRIRGSGFRRSWSQAEPNGWSACPPGVGLGEALASPGDIPGVQSGTFRFRTPHPTGADYSTVKSATACIEPHAIEKAPLLPPAGFRSIVNVSTLAGAGLLERGTSVVCPSLLSTR